MKKVWRLATAFALTLGMAWGIDSGYDAYQDWKAEGGRGMVAQSENVSSAEGDRIERQEQRDVYIERYDRILESMDMIQTDSEYWIQEFVVYNFYEGDVSVPFEELRNVETRLGALVEEVNSLEPPPEYRDEHDLLVTTLTNAAYDAGLIYENAVFANTAYDSTENILQMRIINDNTVYAFSLIERDLASTDNDYNAL